MKLEALFKSQIGHEDFHRRNPEAHEIDSPRDIRKGVTYKFEDEVFNFLLKNKERLGIRKVIEFKNSIIDGGLILNNNEAILLEIKYALGWVKSCQARLQFQRFHVGKLSKEIQFRKTKRALIVFHHFSGDWERKPKNTERHNLDGWNRFYQEEEILGTPLSRTHIMQYKNKKAYICNDTALKDFIKIAK
jgi:hypothetical protein